MMKWINALRLAGWVFWWLVQDKESSVYKLIGRGKFGIETYTILIGRGREAWRISHLAIEAWGPKE